MKNTHHDAIKVDFKGKETAIKLGPAAFRIAKLKGVLDFNIQDLNNLNLDVLGHLVYVGLLVDNPDLEEIEVMQWLANCPNEEEIIGMVTDQLLAVGDFIKKAMGVDEDGEEKEEDKETDEKKQPSTSAPSTP